jgi:hypothetical protein
VVQLLILPVGEFTLLQVVILLQLIKELEPCNILSLQAAVVAEPKYATLDGVPEVEAEQEGIEIL